MNTSNTSRFYLTLLAIVVTVVTGCASTPSKSAQYRTERHSAGGVMIESVRIAQTIDGFQVSGSLSRTVGYDNSPRRHLDVETVAPDGSVTSRVAATFSPNPIRRSRHSRTSANYSVSLPETPPVGSLVRVSVHATSRSDCHN